MLNKMINFGLKELIDTGTSLKDAGLTSNINERAKYKANTGFGVLDTANINIDGTGAIVNVITAALNGTLIKEITIQAITNVTKGMVRLFVFNNLTGTNFLLDEIEIPSVTISGISPAFSITYELDYDLKSGYSLRASTQNASQRFVVTAQGLDYNY